jgi:catechol 2,3-dioxygenase-like lactoylglutathione lyase family enzyme
MATPVLKVTGINHVVLHVRDMTQSLAFYRGVLGFETRNESDGPGPKRAFLRCGSQGLDLFEVTEEVYGGKEMNHMALNVEAEELAEILTGLAAAGVAASEPTKRNSVFIHDPDGHQIEMLPLSANERRHERERAQAALSS